MSSQLGGKNKNPRRGRPGFSIGVAIMAWATPLVMHEKRQKNDNRDRNTNQPNQQAFAHIDRLSWDGLATGAR
jgi:hypothetical protein